MYDKDLIRVHTQKRLILGTSVYGHFATITHDQHRLYESPVHLDSESLRGWLKDFKAALRDARCLWCGDSLNYVTEIDELDIFGFCSTDCQAEALKEAHDENLVR